MIVRKATAPNLPRLRPHAIRGIADSVSASVTAFLTTADYPGGVGLRTRRFRKERLVVLVGLGLASLGCAGLELVRERHFATVDFRFLLWNLFLAWVPFSSRSSSTTATAAARRSRGSCRRSCCGSSSCRTRRTSSPTSSTSRPRASAALVRRSRALGVRVDGHAARLRLALPRARGRAAPLRRHDRLGGCPRRAPAGQRRRLPRPREALEQLGRAHPAALPARPAARPPRRPGVAGPRDRRHARDDPRARARVPRLLRADGHPARSRRAD